MSQSKVLQNHDYLQGLVDSMQCAINKAKHNSPCEDMYFVEKLRKMAFVMGFSLEGHKAFSKS